MTDDNRNTDAVLQMVQKMQQTIFNRVVVGKFDYESDLVTLERFVQTLTSMQATDVLWLVYRTIGAVHLQAMYPSRAIAAWQHGLDILEEAGQRSINAIGLNYNIALALQQLDRNAQAIERFKMLLGQFMDMEDGALHNGFVLLMIVADMMKSQLIVDDVLGAATTEQRLDDLNLSITYNRQYTRGLVKLWRSTAELEFERGNYREAWDKSKLGYEQAIALNDVGARLEFAYIQQHIVDADAAYAHETEEVAARIESALQDMPVQALRGAALLNEARWQLRHGNAEQAEALSLAAQRDFQAVDASEALELTRQLMSQLPES